MCWSTHHRSIASLIHVDSSEGSSTSTLDLRTVARRNYRSRGWGDGFLVVLARRSCFELKMIWGGVLIDFRTATINADRYFLNEHCWQIFVRIVLGLKWTVFLDLSLAGIYFCSGFKWVKNRAMTVYLLTYITFPCRATSYRITTIDITLIPSQSLAGIADRYVIASHNTHSCRPAHN
jgi:hypothetical protein